MKQFVLAILFFLPLKLFAAEMGTYIDLMHNVSTLENSSENIACKQEVIHFSKSMIAAADQTMAETIMFMLIQSERNNKPIFCVLKIFH